MATLIQHLEEHLDANDLEDAYLNEFQDEDLAMYPAIAIKEVELSADECETIANNIIVAINSAKDDQAMTDPARALVALAYNSLMDRNERKPLFQLDKWRISESWLRICGESDLDLREYLTRNETTALDPQKLKLTKLNASEFERKANIGAWAFFHLRLMGNLKGALWSKASTSQFERCSNGFGPAYKFPKFKGQAAKLLADKYMDNKSGECLYLLYRTIIVKENTDYLRIREIHDLVFHEQRGLANGRLWLWTWLSRVEGCEGIKEVLRRLLWVFDSLASEDDRYVKYMEHSSEALDHFAAMVYKYLSPEPEDSPKPKSKYFRYARLVNRFYFHSMGLKANRELISALVYIVEHTSSDKNHTISHRPTKAPWRKWGDEIGKRYLEKKELELKEAEKRFSATFFT